nr:aldose 1-epimerase family protein [uncultured Agathobaculum sp.]
MQVLENSMFRVGIDELGAELNSFWSKSTGTEYIWQGDPAIWKRHAPILFPIIGRLKDKTYTVGGKAYEITQHGFGRDLVWQARRESDACVSFTLTPNEYTGKMYPWDFVCTVRYTLDGISLKKEHITENRSDTPMYYEIGGHDGYTLCWQQGERITDYFIAFAGVDKLRRVVTDEAVMLTEERVDMPLAQGHLPITRALFANDAVMVDGLPVRRAAIGCTKNGRTVTMDFADFDYFAVWSPYRDCETPFVCFEPWSSLPDGAHLDHAIEHKQGVRVLQPGQCETLTFTTTIRE